MGNALFWVKEKPQTVQLLELPEETTEQLVELPEEIIEEILLRSPVKSLLRFRCVAKSWHSLIDSKRFINKHLQDSTRGYAAWRFIFKSLMAGRLMQYSMLSFIHDSSVRPSTLDDDPENEDLMTGGVVGSCNGVLCILKNPGFFFLWNPATRRSLELPEIEHATTKYGFGWDEESDAYKVFVVVSKRNETRGKVYSTRTKSWKTIDHGCLSLCDGIGKFAYGKIHWLPRSSNHVESLDLKSDLFGMIDIPCEANAPIWLSSERSDCLTVTYDKCYRVWVMEKNGVKESWAKVTAEPGKRVFGSFLGCFHIESLVSPDPNKN